MKRAQRAQLALLLEVAGTPKPGNVDRHREYPDLRFEHFLAGAVGAYDGLAMAVGGARLGAAFERAVAGMAEQDGGNTQFGALLLLMPLVKAATEAELTPEAASRIAAGTTVADAADFYRAFEHVDVAVAEPPADLAELDVRRGAAAIPAIESRGLSLYDVMAASASRDGIAREWVSAFERSFDAADRIGAAAGPVPERAAGVFLELLAQEPDPFVAIQHGDETAREASKEAQAALDGEIDPETLAAEFVTREINPGTTADLIAGGLFIAIERGLIRV